MKHQYRKTGGSYFSTYSAFLLNLPKTQHTITSLFWAITPDVVSIIRNVELTTLTKDYYKIDRLFTRLMVGLVCGFVECIKSFFSVQSSFWSFNQSMWRLLLAALGSRGGGLQSPERGDEDKANNQLKNQTELKPGTAHVVKFYSPEECFGTKMINVALFSDD